MPSWATDFSINVLLKYINEDLLPNQMDSESALRVLWLCDFFKVKELVDIVIE